MNELKQLRESKGALLDALKEAGADVSKPSAIKCPFHEDAHASAGVYEEAGVWRFKCQASSCAFGGDVMDVRAKVTGKRVADLIANLKPKSVIKPTPPPAAKKVWANVAAIRSAMPAVKSVFEYTNPETGAVDMYVFRLEKPDGKSFMQGRSVEGGIILEAPEKPWPLYARGRIFEANSVVVVEGEKCVHALAAVRIPATTSPGGAGKASHADWSYLAGKTVYLWPDADPPNAKGQRTGIAHMREVAKILEQLDPAPRVLWVNCDDLGLPPKGDAADYIAQHVDMDTAGKRLAVEAVLNDAEPMGPSGEVRSLIEDTIAGRRRAIGWPWENVASLTKALLPGTVTALCGDPGSSKSFMLIEAGQHWHHLGVKVAIYELEEDRRYHLYRALAQKVGESQLFDDEWVAANPDKARYYVDHYAAFMDSFGRCIHAAPDEQVSLDALIEWMSAQAVAGARIIAIDPITAAATSDKPWLDDLKFIMAAKTIARQYEVSIILVTHPRKGRKGGTFLDDLAGGAAYSRFSQTVMWLEQLEPAEAMEVPLDKKVSAHLTKTVTANRLLKLNKTRNGKGAGLRLAFNFDGKTLRFEEFGIQVKEDK